MTGDAASGASLISSSHALPSPKSLAFPDVCFMSATAAQRREAPARRGRVPAEVLPRAFDERLPERCPQLEVASAATLTTPPPPEIPAIIAPGGSRRRVRL